MSVSSERGDRTALVAIAGNPNVGKTSVFNLLTGNRQKVTNYPGVTVERFEGSLQGDEAVRVLDVPGTYSLSARSREEELAIQAIAGLGGETSPDLVVVVVDATQLSRNLYLALRCKSSASRPSSLSPWATSARAPLQTPTPSRTPLGFP